MQKINITPLWDLVVIKEQWEKEAKGKKQKERYMETLRKRIEPNELIDCSINFYLGIRAVGIDRMDVCAYYSKNKDEYQPSFECKGKELPEELRAMAEYIFIIVAQLKVLNKEQKSPTSLDSHYGLTRPLKDILGPKMIKWHDGELEITNIQDLIDLWFKE